MEIEQCIECDEPAVWTRHTQFAGSHPYCDHCAALEDDFDENDSTTEWELIEELEKPE